MDNTIIYTDNHLNINNIKVEFKYKISKFLQSKNLIFILLKIPDNIELDDDAINNIYAFNYQGNIEWRIKNIKPIGNDNYICMPLETLILNENDQLLTTDFMGRHFEINQKNGHLKLINFIRF